MKEIDLKYVYSVKEENDPEALDFIKKANEVLDALEAGTLYVKFVDGDRKGSIAKVIPKNGWTYERPAIYKRSTYYNRYDSFEIKNQHIFAKMKWTGKSHQPELHLPSKEVVLLIDYDGPTIWQKFDAKAAKEELLSQPDQHDIDGNVLSVGDAVIYANIRYGSGTELDHGTIDRFEASVDSKRHTIFTIVKNTQGIESKIERSEQLIWKKL